MFIPRFCALSVLSSRIPAFTPETQPELNAFNAWDNLLRAVARCAESGDAAAQPPAHPRVLTVGSSLGALARIIVSN